jgi:hypothetical protein
MRKIPNFGYHLARWKGNALRRFYRGLLPVLVRSSLSPPRPLTFDVFAYSSEEMLPEQIASIRSFLRYVGRPKNFIVVSDGSHSNRSVRLLEDVDRSVSVARAARPPGGLPEKFERYLVHHPTGKQLALIMSLPHDGAALYIDSDVRFFPAAAELRRPPEIEGVPAFYLPDCQFAGDRRLLRDSTEQKDQVNTGVLFLFKKLDWSLSISRFLELEGEPSFFTNQTMAHLTMHANGARPFDSAKYVLQLDDQFVFADRYANSGLALRHYVNPVRHKFWTSLNH